MRRAGCAFSVDRRLRFRRQARVLCDGAGDRRIEAVIQRVELHRLARRTQRNFGDGLADITVIVDDLANRESQRGEVAAVSRCRGGNGGVIGRPRFGQSK